MHEAEHEAFVWVLDTQGGDSIVIYNTFVAFVAPAHPAVPTPTRRPPVRPLQDASKNAFLAKSIVNYNTKLDFIFGTR